VLFIWEQLPQALSTLHTDLWRITQPHQALPAINMSPGSSYSNQYLVCMLIHCDNCSTSTCAVIETTILCFTEKWTLKSFFLSCGIYIYLYLYIYIYLSLSVCTGRTIRKWTAFLRITVFWDYRIVVYTRTNVKGLFISRLFNNAV